MEQLEKMGLSIRAGKRIDKQKQGTSNKQNIDGFILSKTLTGSAVEIISTRDNAFDHTPMKLQVSVRAKAYSTKQKLTNTGMQAFGDATAYVSFSGVPKSTKGVEPLTRPGPGATKKLISSQNKKSPNSKTPSVKTQEHVQVVTRPNVANVSTLPPKRLTASSTKADSESKNSLEKKMNQKTTKVVNVDRSPRENAGKEIKIGRKSTVVGKSTPGGACSDGNHTAVQVRPIVVDPPSASGRIRPSKPLRGRKDIASNRNPTKAFDIVPALISSSVQSKSSPPREISPKISIQNDAKKKSSHTTPAVLKPVLKTTPVNKTSPKTSVIAPPVQVKLSSTVQITAEIPQRRKISQTGVAKKSESKNNATVITRQDKLNPDTSVIGAKSAVRRSCVVPKSLPAKQTQKTGSKITR